MKIKFIDGQVMGVPENEKDLQLLIDSTKRGVLSLTPLKLRKKKVYLMAKHTWKTEERGRIESVLSQKNGHSNLEKAKELGKEFGVSFRAILTQWRLIKLRKDKNESPAETGKEESRQLPFNF